MTNLSNLLQAVRLHPEDDAHRLVLSDWLEEHGQPEWAEFLRVQVERARLPLDDPRQPGLLLQDHELLVRHHQDWLGGLRGRCESWEFRRGLLHLTMSAAAFAGAQIDGLGDEQAATWVDEVRVKGLTPRAIGGWSSLPFSHLAALDLSDNGLKLAGARALADAALVAELVALNLENNNLGNKGIQALATSAHLANLRSLRLGRNRLGTEGIRALAASPHLRRLESLDLEWNSAGWAGLAALLTSPHLLCLSRLNLKYNAHAHQKGIAPLPSPRHPPCLTDLDVMGNRLGPKGAAALAASSGLARLTSLDLSCNYIGDEGLAALAQSPHLARLTHLDLYADSVEEKGIEALAASPYLTNLTSLNLARWGPPRSRTAVRLLASWSGLGRLTSLALGVDEEGAETLASSPNTKNLVRLDLHPGWAQDAGAVALASSPFLGNLVFLDLGRNGIGETGALALAGSSCLAGLRRLGLKGNAIGEKATAALRQRFGERVELGEEEEA